MPAKLSTNEMNNIQHHSLMQTLSVMTEALYTASAVSPEYGKEMASNLFEAAQKYILIHGINQNHHYSKEMLLFVQKIATGPLSEHFTVAQRQTIVNQLHENNRRLTTFTTRK